MAGDWLASSVKTALGNTAKPVVALITGARLPPWKLPYWLCSWKSAAEPFSVGDW